MADNKFYIYFIIQNPKKYIRGFTIILMILRKSDLYKNRNKPVYTYIILVKSAEINEDSRIFLKYLSTTHSFIRNKVC